MALLGNSTHNLTSLVAKCAEASLQDGPPQHVRTFVIRGSSNVLKGITATSPSLDMNLARANRRNAYLSAAAYTYVYAPEAKSGLH